MTHADIMLRVINKIGSRGIAEYDDLRAACKLLGVFPERRFNKVFYQTIKRLEARGIIERDDELVVILDYPTNGSLQSPK